MKYLLILVIILGFIGCGEDNDEEKVYTKFVYDKNSTQDKISYLFGSDKVYRTILITRIEELDMIIEELEMREGSYPLERVRQSITTKMKSFEIDFDMNSLFIFSTSMRSCYKQQNFISIDNADNADNAKIESKPFNPPKTCTQVTKPLNEFYMISKDIKTINGIDDF